LEQNVKYDINQLVAEYSGRIYGLALRLTANQADAEDVLQETFLTVIKKLDSFEGRSEIYTWMHRIATNLALGKLRKLKRADDVDISPEDFDNLATGLPKGKGWFDDEDNEFVRELLDDAIGKLPEHHRVVFIMRDVEEMSTRDTANILDISEANVKVRLMRARIQLRNELGHLRESSGRGN